MNGHIERFAPSPTGLLHLGHAFSALTVWEAARAAHGTAILRLDDLDRGRCRPHFASAILDDLGWLGLSWPEPVLYQSQRTPDHLAAIAGLQARGLAYPCYCSRAEIVAAVGAPQEGAEIGPAYPGTCRITPRDVPGTPHALRLDVRRAIMALGGPTQVRALTFQETGTGPDGEQGTIQLDPDALVDLVGDIVIRRKDGAVAYQLSVVLDDAFQGVTHVTRGQDIFTSTPLQRLLQALLGLPTPVYHHHRLIRDHDGRRLAKRDGDQGLASLRAAGATPADIRAAVGL